MPVSDDVIVLDNHRRIHTLEGRWGFGPVWFESSSAQGSTAELDVNFRCYTYPLLIEPGSRVWVEDGFLTVTYLKDPRVELHWANGRRTPVVGVQTVEPAAGDQGVVYVLREQGFYRLADGTVLGVGNIVELEAHRLSVGLQCFPVDFERNEMYHDDRVRLAKDATMPGPLCHGKVVDLTLGSATQRGKVTLFVQ